MGWFDWLRRRPPAEPSAPASETTLPLAPASRDPLAQAAASALGLGWIVVLLDEPVPMSPPAFTAWAQRLGLPASTDGGFRLAGAHAYPGAGPFPADSLAGYGVDELDAGKGFLGLSFGPPGSPLRRRSHLEAPDPWAADGELRTLSKLVLALLAHGRAVVLPEAGRLFAAARVRTRLAGADQLDARPFGGWISWAVDHDQRNYATYGMVLHGLPDVQTTVDPDDAAQLDRACGAILFACHQMVWTNAPLVDDDIVEVPVGVAVGPYRIARPRGACERYRVRVLPDMLEPTPRACVALERIVARA